MSRREKRGKERNILPLPFLYLNKCVCVYVNAVDRDSSARLLQFRKVQWLGVFSDDHLGDLTPRRPATKDPLRSRGPAAKGPPGGTELGSSRISNTEAQVEEVKGPPRYTRKYVRRSSMFTVVVCRRQHRRQHRRRRRRSRHRRRRRRCHACAESELNNMQSYAYGL